MVRQSDGARLCATSSDTRQRAGWGAGSADRQLRQLRRVARHFGGTPAAVSSAQLTRWLSEHPGAASTVKSERITLRAFFRWAELAGIVPVTPMPAPAPVTRYGLDERWQDALDAFEGAQVAARIAPATIAQRLKHLGRFAGEVAGCAVGGRMVAPSRRGSMASTSLH